MDSEDVKQLVFENERLKGILVNDDDSYHNSYREEMENIKMSHIIKK